MLMSKVNIAGQSVYRRIPSPMSSLDQENREMAYLKRLTNAGFDDVLTLRRETAERVLTEKRVDLLAAVAEDSADSVRGLARNLDRDVSVVSRDLDVLYDANVVDFETNGRAKRPVLAHENVLVRPIIFDGSVATK